MQGPGESGPRQTEATAELEQPSQGRGQGGHGTAPEPEQDGGASRPTEMTENTEQQAQASSLPVSMPEGSKDPSGAQLDTPMGAMARELSRGLGEAFVTQVLCTH